MRQATLMGLIVFGLMSLACGGSGSNPLAPAVPLLLEGDADIATSETWRGSASSCPTTVNWSADGGASQPTGVGTAFETVWLTTGTKLVTASCSGGGSSSLQVAVNDGTRSLQIMEILTANGSSISDQNRLRVRVKYLNFEPRFQFIILDIFRDGESVFDQGEPVVVTEASGVAEANVTCRSPGPIHELRLWMVDPFFGPGILYSDVVGVRARDFNCV